MSMWLRQSTASQEILLGPFVDSTDGNAQETGLTIANTDIKLWKEGATTEANKNSGGATHIANGKYYAVLDATDTNTLGKLEVNVHATGALAVRREFMVLPANVYDSLVLGTDYIDSSAVQFAGQTITCSGGVTIPSATLASTTNITSATGVTASTVSDKTGYSLANGSLVTATLGAFALAKTTNITGFNDIAATDIVSAGAITTSGGAVSTVTNLTNAPTVGDLTATMKTSVQTELSTYGALKPTLAGRTLDVTATGAAGIDWANVENPTTTLNLSGTTVTTVVSVTNVGSDVWSYTSRTLTGPARQISTRQVGTITLTKGDSYLNADGNALTFTKATNATWPTDITSWTPKLSIEPSTDLLAITPLAASISDITGTVVTGTGDSRAVRFDFTAAQTATLTATAKALYNYDVQVSSGSSRATVETGVAYVIDEQTTG